ncbi:MAG TPA: hypothetical protein VMR70_19105 [Flavisolibacter sp.]|nr:hypothetical protein [Flavisolibacter sp.]
MLHNKTTRLFSLCLSFLLISFLTSAQLSGNYTINSALATGGTNFRSFNDLASTLTNQGISGSVTVDVVVGSGPYTERVTFTTIAGSGPGATITINGNGNTISAPTSSAERHVLRLAAVSYFTLNNLSVAPTGSTNIMAVHIFSSGSNITVNNVSVDMTGITSTLAGGIVASGSETSILTAGSFSNITFSNNTITGGGYGISFMSTSATNLLINSSC